MITISDHIYHIISIRITAMGQGAGAASVEYLVHSPMIRSLNKMVELMIFAKIGIIAMMKSKDGGID